MTETAYSTDNPEIVATYRQAVAARIAQARKIGDAIETLGADPEKIYSTGDSIGAPTISGITPLADAVPAGWRVVRGRWEPRRGKPGDAARQWLADHQPVDVRGVMEDHGLPRNVWVGGGGGYRIIAPRLFEHDDTLWACFKAPPGSSDSGFDKTPCTWTPRKLSEFYAAKEAVEAAAETEKASAR